LLANCACDPLQVGRSNDLNGEFTWGGCSQFLKYSNVLAKKFIDSQEYSQRDARGLMNLHNNQAGRRVS